MSKQTEKAAHSYESMIDGFKLYSRKINEYANQYAQNQNDPELARLYYIYKQTIGGWVDKAGEHLCIDLPDMPELGDRTFFAGMINLADYCKRLSEKQRNFHPVNIEIELSHFNAGKSKNLLSDLISNPSGVALDIRRHGKKQPDSLKDALKRNGHSDAANAISKQGDKVMLKDQIRLLPKK